MAEESWHEARLIPTSGINGADEQERRATSALLAVVSAVREFGRALVKPLGAPAGAIETYIEVPFVLGEKKFYPDGLIRVSRGDTLLDRAGRGQDRLQRTRRQSSSRTTSTSPESRAIDAVLTISNEIPAVAGQHPTKVDKRKLRKVALHHLSWTQVLGRGSDAEGVPRRCRP